MHAERLVGVRAENATRARNELWGAVRQLGDRTSARSVGSGLGVLQCEERRISIVELPCRREDLALIEGSRRLVVMHPATSKSDDLWCCQKRVVGSEIRLLLFG